jgi:hypothetical protein
LAAEVSWRVSFDREGSRIRAGPRRDLAVLEVRTVPPSLE